MNRALQTVLVTGSTGLVGSALTQHLLQRGYVVRQALRKASANHESRENLFVVGEINSNTKWESALAGVDVVVHLASRVHVMKETLDNPLAAYREINVAGTEQLARTAAACNVRRLVYLSSIKVNGEATYGYPFTEIDQPQPQDAYAFSKYEAEKKLYQISAETGLEVVVIRPPLVYGPKVKGNFLSLLLAVDREKILPLGAIENSRSLIYVGNLVDAIIKCATSPVAAGQTYLVADNEKVPTSELIRQIALSLACKPNLVRVPVWLLKSIAAITGKRDQLSRLTSSLEIDSKKIRSELDWTPPYSMEYGLAETARWFRGLTVQA